LAWPDRPLNLLYLDLCRQHTCRSSQVEGVVRLKSNCGFRHYKKKIIIIMQNDLRLCKIIWFLVIIFINTAGCSFQQAPIPARAVNWFIEQEDDKITSELVKHLNTNTMNTSLHFFLFPFYTCFSSSFVVMVFLSLFNNFCFFFFFFFLFFFFFFKKKKI